MATGKESKKTAKGTTKKDSVIHKEAVIDGAKKEQERRENGHNHPLMQIRLNLLEINHRTIEKIEKERFIIMNKYDGDEAVQIFKDFLFVKLTEGNE